MNVLFLATYGDFLATFEYSNIRLWQELGCVVHCASNFSNKDYNLKTNKLDEIGVIKHEIEFQRFPFKTQNLIAYRQLIRLIRREKIDVVDCHNAVVGVFARLAANKCKLDKVVYTPHSFFFYKGCPSKNRLIYRNIETYMAKKTDLLILINKEDYVAALQMPVRGKALYVPGVGIDTKEIFNIPRKRKKYCAEFGIEENAMIFISVGELIHRKNHITAIKAFAEANISNSFYLICGIGKLTDELKKLISELKIENKVRLLGYRLDAKEIMKASDVFLFPSYQEGLPVALMEAMACGLPCLTSKIRGNVDLVDENRGGLFFEPDDVKTLKSQILTLAGIEEKRHEWGAYNQEKIKEFDVENVKMIMRREYSELLKK